MDHLMVLLDALSQPLRWFGEPAQLLYWPYLLAALGLAALVYVRRARRRRERGVRGFLAFLFPRQVWMHPSTRIDAWFTFIDAALGSLLLGYVVSADLVADGVYSLLVALLGRDFPVVTPGWTSVVALTVVLVLVVDAAFYCAHRLQHRIPALWEFHKVHHSAPVMTPLTVYRNHPVDQLLNGSVAGVGSGLVFGVFDFLHSGMVDAITILGVNVVTFTFHALGANLRHSHVPLAFGRVLGHVFVSPAHHQIHHSTARRHWDKNLGGIFALWDWLAGTLYLPRRDEVVEFGLGNGEEADYGGVLRLYVVPFAKLWRRWRTRVTKAARAALSSP